MTDQDSDINAIQLLKARYCRATDTKQWDLFKQCVTEDFSGFFEGMPRPSKDMPTEAGFAGRDLIVEVQSEALKNVITVHQAYLPEITIRSPTTASGMWAFRDHLRMPTCIFTGYGHYHEEYVKQDGAWLISKLNVTRIYVEEQWL